MAVVTVSKGFKTKLFNNESEYLSYNGVIWLIISCISFSSIVFKALVRFCVKSSKYSLNFALKFYFLFYLI